MKKILIISTIFILTVNFSCKDYLDIVPDNVATIDYSFRNKVSAEKFLFTCYSYLPNIGSPVSDPAIMASDEIYTFETAITDVYNNSAYNIKRGRQNISSPIHNFWDGENGANSLFIGIRDCNIFLENIELVHDLKESERNQWIAEVKFLKAYFHYYLFRMYGPIPIIENNLPISSGINEVRLYREPVDEVVNYIINLIDEAVIHLPMTIQNFSSELGRITIPIALSIKAEVLVTAASPLFNGNTAYNNIVDSRGINLFSSHYEEDKWNKAMVACKNAIDTALLANHKLYEFNDSRYSVSEETKRIMNIRNAFGERWNQEVIWGMTYNSNIYQRRSLPNFTQEHIQMTTMYNSIATPINIAELFYSENGVPIDEDLNYDYPNRYLTAPATDSSQIYYIGQNFETAILNQNRESRFYANLGFDGGVWFGNGRFKDIGMGSSNETSWVLKAKAGDVSGKVSTLHYTATGYFVKKYSHFETSGTTSLSYNRMSFPAIRLADLYLLYAEARNEYLGPDAEVYEYINKVRERAGLNGVVESWENYSTFPDKPFTKEGLREIIQQERMIELIFEGKRFWDVRRWKIAEEAFNKPIKAWNIDGKTTNEYYNAITIESMEFNLKDYFWPLKEHSLRVNPNLIQNPYW